MITAALLAADGGIDLIRGVLPRRAGLVAAVVVGVVVTVALVAAALPVVVAAAVLLVALTWSVLADGVRRPPRRASAGLLALPAFVILALVVDRLVGDLAPTALSAAVAWLTGARLDDALLVLGAALVLFRTANHLTRAALELAQLPEATPSDSAPTTPRWRIEVAGRGIGSVAPPADPPASERLRGGRLIGPLERGFVTVLAVLGAWPALAALVAAKGIVRFPEISGDRGRGSKAEEFLIGSLASWAVAGAVAALLVARLT